MTSLHQQLVATYAPRHPGLTAYPTVEVSRFDPLHTIGFGVPQIWPDQSTITKNTVNQAYTKIADAIHAQHGLMSMNHPFGPNDGPQLSAAGMEAARAATYTTLNGVAVDHADILEVGYTLRGSVNTLTHLALLDTFVRNGYFLTGTGVNDDHGGMNWPNLSNGFVTGIWAASAAQADLVTALAGGRAFAYHPQRWAGAPARHPARGRHPDGPGVARRPSSPARWPSSRPACPRTRQGAGRRRAGRQGRQQARQLGGGDPERQPSSPARGWSQVPLVDQRPLLRAGAGRPDQRPGRRHREPDLDVPETAHRDDPPVPTDRRDLGLADRPLPAEAGVNVAGPGRWDAVPAA